MVSLYLIDISLTTKLFFNKRLGTEMICVFAVLEHTFIYLNAIHEFVFGTW